MTRNPLKDGNISENSSGIGTVTRQMVLGRAEELAIINGRWLHNVSSSDFEQARQQLTGEPDMAPQEGTLESAPESTAPDIVVTQNVHFCFTMPPQWRSAGATGNLGRWFWSD